MLWLWTITAIYAAGVVFLLGALFGEYGSMDWDDWLIVAAWPLWYAYVLVWGRHRNRRWYCWLVGHDDHTVTTGVTVRGEKKTAQQCQRCWRKTNDQEDD